MVSEIVTCSALSLCIFVKAMCSYQTLYHSSQSGYVVRCTECDKIQVAFSTFVITFESADFNAFGKMVATIRNARHPSAALPTVRSTMIPLPYQGIQLLLNENELSELCAMLEEADTEMRTIALLKLFEMNNYPNDL